MDSAKGRTDEVSSLAGYRRAKSLDRRATETLMTVRPQITHKSTLIKAIIDKNFKYQIVLVVI